MHDMPSVTYEDSYKRRGKPWEKGLFGNPIVGWMRLCQSSDYETIVSLVRQRILERGLLSQGVLSSTSYCIPPLYNPIAAQGSAGKKSTQGVGWEVDRWVIAFGSSTSSFTLGGDRQQGKTSNDNSSGVSSFGERQICVEILFCMIYLWPQLNICKFQDMFSEMKFRNVLDSAE